MAVVMTLSEGHLAETKLTFLKYLLAVVAYALTLALVPTCGEMGRFNLPIACSMVRNLPVRISPIYMSKNDTLFMKY